eukprot:688036-Alexandrium_andersonii.AAC.1
MVEDVERARRAAPISRGWTDHRARVATRRAAASASARSRCAAHWVLTSPTTTSRPGLGGIPRR